MKPCQYQSLYWLWQPTIINLFQLANDIESDIREFVFEQMEEERKQMFDGGVFPKQGSKAANMGAQSSSYVLGGISREIANAWEDLVQNNLAVIN